MTNWKADLHALVEETVAFAKKHHVEPPMPRTIVEPSRTPSINLPKSERINLPKSEREEIRQRVSNFKMHQPVRERAGPANLTICEERRAPRESFFCRQR